jgi:hypothetical protein
MEPTDHELDLEEPELDGFDDDLGPDEDDDELEDDDSEY